MNVQYTASPSAVSANVPPCEESESAEEPQPLQPFKVRVSVFFDGTGNNMFNTRAGLHGRGSQDGSFGNEYSNIAKLSNYLTLQNNERDYHFSVYVEGMGTLHDNVDDDVGTTATGAGMAFGTGDRGIVNRVTNAIRRIFLEIRNLGHGTNREITNLWIDAFGFSRGAAAARHFVHRVFSVYQGSSSLRTFVTHRNHGNFIINELKIKFIGLYDTVGSFRVHGVIGALGSIEDDPQELHLHFTPHIGDIDKVVHIAAADEVRLNFPLTDITSAGGKGTTIFVPGAHSDVGGGYNNVSHSRNGRRESNLHVYRIAIESPSILNAEDVRRKLLDEKNRLIRLGYYQTGELEISDDGRNAFVIIANRRDISNDYAKVPLKIMADEASQGGLILDASLQTDNELHPFLNTVYNFINANKSQSIAFWTSTNNPAFLPELRHGYFHSSAHYTPRSILGYTVYPLKIQFHSPGYNYEESEYNAYFGERKRRILVDNIDNAAQRESDDAAASRARAEHTL